MELLFPRTAVEVRPYDPAAGEVAFGSVDATLGVQRLTASREPGVEVPALVVVTLAPSGGVFDRTHHLGVRRARRVRIDGTEIDPALELAEHGREPEADRVHDAGRAHHGALTSASNGSSASRSIAAISARTARSRRRASARLRSGGSPLRLRSRFSSALRLPITASGQDAKRLPSRR